MSLVTRRRALIAAAVVLVLAAGGYLLFSWLTTRADRRTAAQMRQDIAALEAERTALRARMEELVRKDPRLEGLPEAPVRVGVPTSLAGELIKKVITGVTDQVTLELKNLRVRKRGTVRRVITIGDYELDVLLKRVIGTLRPGTPTVTFGGNRVTLAMPLHVAEGTGEASINFKWDGRNISGAVCGDLDVTRTVSGAVRPRTYPVSASLQLTSTDTEMLAEPAFPVIRVNLGVEPTAASWQSAQQILDDRTGVCGFVVDRINIMGIVKRLIDKGFNVRLPTEKVKAMALPVGIDPTMTVKGQPVALGITVGDLTITEHQIWLGADVSVAIGDEAAKVTAARAAAPSKAIAERKVP